MCSKWVFVGLFAVGMVFAPHAAAASKPKKKRPGTKVDHVEGDGAPKATKKAATPAFGLYGALGLQQIDFKETAFKVELGGFGFGGGAAYYLALSPKMTIPLNAGFSITSMSGSTAGEPKLTMTLQETTLDFGGGFLFGATSNLAFGLLVEYNLGTSGTLKLEAEEFTYSETVKSYSTTQIGAALPNLTTAHSQMSFEIWSLNGSLTTEAEETGESDPVKFGGFRLRFKYIYMI